MQKKTRAGSIAYFMGLLVACQTPMLAGEWHTFTFNLGGGATAPLNPTARFAGVGGNFNTSAGYNLNSRSSISGEFTWAGLPPNVFALQPVTAPFGNINAYFLGANYRYHHDRLGHGPFGLYGIVGGGWYSRVASVDKSYVVPPGTACQPIYTWWGYGCDPSGFVYTATIFQRSTNSGGMNGGVGFTIRLGDSGLKFYTEARYHYAWSARTPTTFVPVTFGFRFN